MIGRGFSPSPRWILAVLVVTAGLALRTAAEPLPGPEPDPFPIEGVLFLPGDGTLYAPVEDLAAALSLEVREERKGSVLFVQDRKVPAEERRALPDGTQLVRLRFLTQLGESRVAVTWDREREMARAEHDGLGVWIRRGRRSVLEGITFAGQGQVLYAPVHELAQALGLPESGESGHRAPTNFPWKPSPEQSRFLADGTELVALGAARDGSLVLDWRADEDVAHLRRGEWEAWVQRSEKRVVINVKAQRMRAWQGERLVLDTNISSGRRGMETPRGAFAAGPLKAPLLISRKYNNARMPWSVQVRGDILIHGFSSVPRRAASHGCIRVPLTGRNPARWFYQWVSVGTPILITGDWPDAGDTAEA
jgi:L,D-transpeptidase-like protein